MWKSTPSPLAGVLVDGPTSRIPQFQSGASAASGRGASRTSPPSPTQGHKAPHDEPHEEQGYRVSPGNPPCRHEESRDAGHDEKEGDQSKETRGHRGSRCTAKLRPQ